MKRILLLILLVFIITSCSKDEHVIAMIKNPAEMERQPEYEAIHEDLMSKLNEENILIISDKKWRENEYEYNFFYGFFHNENKTKDYDVKLGYYDGENYIINDLPSVEKASIKIETVQYLFMNAYRKKVTAFVVKKQQKEYSERLNLLIYYNESLIINQEFVVSDKGIFVN